MKLPDMLLQAEIIGRWFAGKNVVFIGDGDAIDCRTFPTRAGSTWVVTSRLDAGVAVSFLNFSIALLSSASEYRLPVAMTLHLPSVSRAKPGMISRDEV
jgi:hypothetical protein